MLTGVQSCGELHSEEEESTATSQSPSPQQNDTPWWGAPSTQDRKLKSGSGGLESLLEGYMQHKRQMDEADQKRHEELKTGFENFMRMQQEAEERWFSAIQERQQANSQLFMYMVETFAKALLPQSHTTSGQWMPPMFSYSCTTHNTASPQNFENPVESLASYLLDNMAPHTSSSLLHDVNVITLCVVLKYTTFLICVKSASVVVADLFFLKFADKKNLKHYMVCLLLLIYVCCLTLNFQDLEITRS